MNIYDCLNTAHPDVLKNYCRYLEERDQIPIHATKLSFSATKDSVGGAIKGDKKLSFDDHKESKEDKIAPTKYIKARSI